MKNDRKLVIFFLMIMLILLLRDTPHINLLIIDQLWIAYILVIGIIVFFFIPRKEAYLPVALFVLLLLALIFTIVGIAVAIKVTGIIIYFLLWIIVIQKTYILIRKREHDSQ